jgi:hypothetical protein
MNPTKELLNRQLLLILDCVRLESEGDEAQDRLIAGEFLNRMYVLYKNPENVQEKLIEKYFKIFPTTGGPEITIYDRPRRRYSTTEMYNLRF